MLIDTVVSLIVNVIIKCLLIAAGLIFLPSINLSMTDVLVIAVIWQLGQSITFSLGLKATTVTVVTQEPGQTEEQWLQTYGLSSTKPQK